MLDYKLNYAKKIFFVGIGGISMSALAMILTKKGFDVSGYDRAHNDETERLEMAGVTVHYELDCSLDGVDLVVYTAAVDTTHPLMSAALGLGIPLLPRARLLDIISSEYKNSIGIAGTHGKSTTSGLLSCVFEHSDKDSTYLVGAFMPFLGAAYKIGSDESFIFEADEYKNSFLSFNPRIAVVLNIELDHVDFFGSLDSVLDSFSQYINKAEIAIVNMDCPNTKNALNAYGGKVFGYSVKDSNADFYGCNLTNNGGFYDFDVVHQGGFLAHISLSIPGIHNVSNALAAFATAYINGVPPQAIASGMKAFCGVSRRFEFIAEINGGRVFDDYAHHPDEIAASLTAARDVAKNRVIAVFQPHTYSRLRYFFDSFVAALSTADLVVVTEVYSAREAQDPEINGEKLANALQNAIFVADFDEIAAKIKDTVVEGDVVILLTAGDLHGITRYFLTRTDQIS